MSASVGKPLTSSELEDLKCSYARDGYFIVRNVVSPEYLAELQAKLKAKFDEIVNSGELRSYGGLMSGHLNCYPGEISRIAYDSLQERGVIDLIKELNPNVLRLPNIGCNFNLPGSHAQHYHTDRPFTREFMIVNVGVVDTVVENGAIDLVPGTHKRFYKYTQFVWERLYRNSKRVPMNRGDVLVRSSNVWHRGMPNRTSNPRAMLAFTWEDGGSAHEDPFQIEGGTIQFLSNWFRPTRIGRLREHVFVKVPFIYSAFRLGRSLCDSTY